MLTFDDAVRTLAPSTLGHFEPALDLAVAIVVAEAVVEGVNVNPHVAKLLTDLLDFVERDGFAPRSQPFPFRSRVVAAMAAFKVACPQLAQPDADIGERSDSGVRVTVAKAVTLGADRNAADDGVDLRRRRQASGRKSERARHRKSVKVSTIHGYPFHAGVDGRIDPPPALYDSTPGGV